MKNKKWQLHEINQDFKEERKFKRKQIVYYDQKVNLRVNGNEIELEAGEKLKFKSGDKLEYIDEMPKIVYSRKKYKTQIFFEKWVKPLMSIFWNILIFITTLTSILITGFNKIELILLTSVSLITFTLIIKTGISYVLARKKLIELSNYKIKIEITNLNSSNTKHNAEFMSKGRFIKSFYLKMKDDESRLHNLKYNLKNNILSYKYIQVKEKNSEPENIFFVGIANIFLTPGEGTYYTDEKNPNQGKLELKYKK